MVKFCYTINFDTDGRLTEEEESELIEFVNRFGDEVVIEENGVALVTERRTDETD